MNDAIEIKNTPPTTVTISIRITNKRSTSKLLHKDIKRNIITQKRIIGKISFNCSNTEYLIAEPQ